MFEKLTPEYRFTCDRCGKVQETFDDPHFNGAYYISFNGLARVVGAGYVCKRCYIDFLQLAENFFDEANKSEEGGEE